jgi:hypothetical protein
VLELTEGPRGEVVVRISGGFDATAAAALAACLMEVPRGAELVLDFTRVRFSEDHGLAWLAGELGPRLRLEVRGLTRHQERLLRYLGLGARAAPPP